MNKLYLTLLTIPFIFSFGCKSKSSKESNAVTSDSLITRQEEEYESDPFELRKKYISDYNKIEIFDTTIVDKFGTIIQVQTKYYCLFDNAINLPGQYVWEDTTKTFQTHNFAQDIKIIIDKDTIFNKTISKVDFVDKLYPELKSFSVLMFPNFSYDKEKEVFDFGYSLTIPITDVGLGIRLLIDKKGKSTITNE